jgi:hypothetical protein
MGKRLGLLRAIYLVSASCMGSFAFAFDTGVISALQSLVPIREEKKRKKKEKRKKKKRKEKKIGQLIDQQAAFSRWNPSKGTFDILKRRKPPSTPMQCRFFRPARFSDASSPPRWPRGSVAGRG